MDHLHAGRVFVQKDVSRPESVHCEGGKRMSGANPECASAEMHRRLLQKQKFRQHDAGNQRFCVGWSRLQSVAKARLLQKQDAHETLAQAKRRARGGEG